MAKKSTAAGKISELQMVADQCESLVVDIEADLAADKYVQLNLQTWQSTNGPQARGAHFERGGVYRSDDVPGSTLTACMKGLAKRWKNAEPRLASVKIKSKKAPLPTKDLKYLTVCAWCEAFGLPIPSKDDVKKKASKTRQTAKHLREQAIAKLMQGPSGVAWFNALNRDERKSLGSFRNADLSASNLNEVSFGHFNLQAANFDNAKLKDAIFGYADLKRASFRNVSAKGVVLVGAKCSDAFFTNADLRSASARFASFLRSDFSNANLSNSELHNCNFGGASFIKANLTTADLRETNLRGVDFTGAQLTRTDFAYAKFDSDTVFPKSFQHPETMKWVGKGKDPRKTR